MVVANEGRSQDNPATSNASTADLDSDLCNEQEHGDETMSQRTSSSSTTDRSSAGWTPFGMFARGNDSNGTIKEQEKSLDRAEENKKRHVVLLMV